MTHMRFVRLFLICSVFLLLPLLSHAEIIEAEADFTAWSGYWWSTNGGGLANGYGLTGEPAPLEKYEQYTLGGYPHNATLWELQNHYDPAAPSWFGQCHAWASAAVYENIDFVPTVINHILYRVGDKKGLLTAAHHDDPAVRVAGDPVSFHSFLLTYILENGRGFVADLGSPDEAWFYPIYRFSMDVTKSSSALFVKCYIWYADDRVDPDYLGTNEKIAYYEYRLDLNSNGEIVTGAWTGVSVNNHPKSEFYPLSPQAANPYIDYETIKQIATTRDDELESDQVVRLDQGQRTLVLLNKDEYFIDCKEGELLRIDLKRLDRDSQRTQVVLRDDTGNVWYDALLDDSSSIKVVAPVDSRFDLTFSRPNYDEPGIYQVECEVSSPLDVLQPSLRRGSAWNGFAITNASDIAINDVSLVSCDAEGRPLMTLIDPVTFNPGEKKIFNLSTFAIPLHEQGQAYSLRLTHGNKLQSLFLGGDWQQNMSGFGPDMPVSSRIVIPDTSSMFDALKAVNFGVTNRSQVALPVEFKLYNAQGTSMGSRTEVLSPLSIENYSETSNPFNTSINDGWYVVNAPSQSLQGFTSWRSGLQQYESLPGLSDFGTIFSVPHLAVDVNWNTYITLINMSDQPNTVTCRLLQGGIYAEDQVILAPHQKRLLPMGEQLFATIPASVLNASALELLSTAEMTGYFTYQADQSNARIPLLAPRLFSTSLTIPHVASDDYWWTGIALINLSTKDTAYTLTSYDSNGQKIYGGSVTRSIMRQSKDVFALNSVFTAVDVKNIAWIKIESIQQQVAGIVLYGGMPIDVVTGCVLRPN